MNTCSILYEPTCEKQPHDSPNSRLANYTLIGSINHFRDKRNQFQDSRTLFRDISLTVSKHIYAQQNYPPVDYMEYVISTGAYKTIHNK